MGIPSRADASKFAFADLLDNCCSELWRSSISLTAAERVLVMVLSFWQLLSFLTVLMMRSMTPP